MKFLTAGEILAVKDLKREDVAVPEWGDDCGVHVQELSLADRITFLNCSFDESGTNGATPKRVQRPESQALLLSMVIVDDNGDPVFDNADVKTLMRKSPRAADRIVAVAMRLSGFAADAVEVAEKNSDGIPSSASSSDLH